MLQTAQRLATTVLPALAILVPGLFPAVACGQDDDALDTLIFEPVLLDAGMPVSGGGDPVTTVGRLQEMAALEAGDVFPPAGDVTAADRVAAIAAYEEEVAALERTEGQYAAALTEKLLSLGRLLQQQDDHSRAISVFERADHISRVNNGLYHPEQMAIIERQVESYLALGDFAAVNDKQHYLLYLSRKLDEIGGLARVPALAGLGDQNMYAFDLALLEQRDNAGQGSFRPGGMEAPGAPEIARYHAINSLFRAKSHYSDAIATLIENSNFLNPRLLELEYKFLETLFLAGYSQELIDNPHYYMTSARRTANMPSRWNYLRRNAEGYQAGIDTFERILVYLDNDPGATPDEQVRARLELGDWHLVFGWDEAAAMEYRRAWELARALDMDPDSMRALFTPDFPAQLPLFTPKPNSREKFAVDPGLPFDYDGYIDVSFLINRNGTARNIRITGKSDSASFAITGRLRRYLKNSPFRPHIRDGNPVNREEVNLRYYFVLR